MNQKYNCQQLSTRICTIKSKIDDFNVMHAQNNIETSVKLMYEINQMVKEIEKGIWPYEILTKENIEKQYDEWEEMYNKLNPGFSLPSKPTVFEFLKRDPEFIELMKIKEKQGLTKMIISPAPYRNLEGLADRIQEKIIENGGNMSNYAEIWRSMFANEGLASYFMEGNSSDLLVPETNLTVQAKNVISHPEEYGICDGWMISFTTDEQNLSRSTDPDLDTGNGRIAIKTGLGVWGYVAKYFSGNNPDYIGEEAMTPKEYLALFVKDLYEKYIKTGKKITEQSEDLFGSKSITWFASTTLYDQIKCPSIRWSTNERLLRYDFSYSNSVIDTLGVRSVVRRCVNQKNKS